MPELPEVETIVRSLQPLVTGRRILDAELPSSTADAAGSAILRRILREPMWRTPREFVGAIRGSVIARVRRHGKHLVFDLGPSNGAKSPRSLLIHLGMTGRLTCEATPEPRSAHTHLILSLDAPGPVPSAAEGRWLHYTDIRRFGRWQLLDPSAEVLGNLGPDPLEVSFSEFDALLRARRAMLKSLLLDQRFLRGLGNIYADESLFRARIHPAALAAGLTREQAKRLYQGIRQTLRLAIAAGGSSISNYVDGLGNSGYFQHEHVVYRRTGQPCVRCGCRIRRMLIASRSTHFCPRCQRAGRVHRTTGSPGRRVA
ncbi:MAG: bifunctional DNA-formamidopyrimidine glycosylase/DNA-(apurinic or apyrimidinic site) lyase [Terriglobia bacterium]